MVSMKLQRIDHFQINSTSKGCAVLLVGEYKTPFSVLAVSDSSGQVNLFRFTESRDTEQKTFYVEKPVSKLKADYQTKKDKPRLIIAHNKQISTYSTRGKLLRSYDSNVDGQIQAFDYSLNNIYMVTGHVYQKVYNNKEEEFLLCPDAISDIMVVTGIGDCSTAFVVLACQDCYVRILKGGVVSFEVELNGAPVCLAKGQSFDLVFFGSANGTFGLIQLLSTQAVVRWTQSPSGQYGPVIAIEHYDLDRDGEPELIVAYEKGVVQVFVYDEFGYPQLVYEVDHHDRLTSMVVGIFSNQKYPEIICITYTGSIFGLTTAPGADHPDSGRSENPTRVGRERILKKLQEELKQLETQATELRASLNETAPRLVVLNPLEVTHTFQLDPNLSAYVLRIECIAPIDHILVQSDCPVDLLDVVENLAIKSVMPSNPNGDENSLLATYRCQANINRMELRLRTTEGKYGTLSVYVVPSGQMPCACSRLQVPIWPLALHRRIHEFTTEGPVNQLKLEGKFSLAEMHQWIVFCLPDAPERPPIYHGDNADSAERAQLVYECTFLPSQLECSYQRNRALFRSDNLCTISILKDVLTKEATKRKIHFIMDLDIHPDSVEYTLRTIHPRLESLLLLGRKVHLIKPLQELVASETQGTQQTGDTSARFGREENPLPNSLPADCAAIWRDATQLQKAFEDQSCILDRLYGCVIDLYIDKYRFKGVDIKSRVPALFDLLNNYDFEKVLQYFDEV